MNARTQENDKSKQEAQPQQDKAQEKTPQHVILFAYNPNAASRSARRALGILAGPGTPARTGELGALAQFPEEPEEEFAELPPGEISAKARADARADVKERELNAPDDWLKGMSRYDALVIGRRDFDDHDRPVLNLVHFRHDDPSSHHALNGVDWSDTLERTLDVPHQSDREQQAFFYLCEGEKLVRPPVDEDEKPKSTSGPKLVDEGDRSEVTIDSDAAYERAVRHVPNTPPESPAPENNATDSDLTQMSKTERKEELGTMSKAELTDLAGKHDVTVTSDMNKGEITSAINKQLNKEAKTGT